MRRNSHLRDHGVQGLTVLLCLLAITLVLVPDTAPGQVQYCVAPVKPACLALPSTFEREEALDRCRQDVENYIDENRAYGRCLSHLQAKAKKQAEEVMRTFACRAQGGRGCNSDFAEP